MDLIEILKQPDGFTPPDVTVKIERVYDYKSGDSERGPWSFQNIKVSGGQLKLKGLPEFPKAREGQTVTLRANQSKQHGLTGLKVNHEEYGGKTYHQLVVTNSAKWEWATNGNGHNGSNGSQPKEYTIEPSEINAAAAYRDHVLACANIAEQVAKGLTVSDEAAIQACFATVMIDTKNRNLLLAKPGANGDQAEPEEEIGEDDPRHPDYVPF